MARLGDQIDGFLFSVMLVDREGRMVATSNGSRAIEPILEKVGAVPGSVWREEFTGANALALPLETGRPISINGPEHYLDSLRAFSCYGRPIIGPRHGRLEGVLDMMVDGDVVHPLVQPVIDAAVAEIERNLARDYRDRRGDLTTAFDLATAHPASAVIAFDSTRVIKSVRAAALIMPEDLVALRSLAAESGAGVFKDWVLHRGDPATVEISQVESGGTVATLRVSDHAHIPRASAPLSRNGRIAQWIEHSRTSLDSKLIVGEVGTGRSTVLSELAAACGATILSISDDDNRAGFLHFREAVSSGRPTVVAIDDIDLLRADELAFVLRATSRPNTRVLASAITDDPEFLESLYPHFATRITLPVLRDLRHEVMTTAQTIAGPGTLLRFDGPATNAFLSHRWPGNLAELTIAVEHLAARRGRVIGIQDLPPTLRSVVSGATTPWQRAQRYAIEDALMVTRGNKAKAAKFLGISRNTLYHHMKEYGLHG